MCQRQNRIRQVMLASCPKQGQGMILCVPKCQRESQSRQELVTSFLKQRQRLVLRISNYLWSGRQQILIQMRL